MVRAEIATPEESLAEMQAKERLARAVARLGEPDRHTVVLRFVDGWSAAEIGRALGVPEGTVRWRLKTGLDALRRQIDAAAGDWRRALLPLARPLTAAPEEGLGGQSAADSGGAAGTMAVTSKALSWAAIAAVAPMAALFAFAKSRRELGLFRYVDEAVAVRAELEGRSVVLHEFVQEGSIVKEPGRDAYRFRLESRAPGPRAVVRSLSRDRPGHDRSEGRGGRRRGAWSGRRAQGTRGLRQMPGDRHAGSGSAAGRATIEPRRPPPDSSTSPSS